VHRLLRSTTRLLALVGLAGLLAGVPAALVVLVGRPYPSGAQLTGAWRTQQVDTDTVIRFGWAVFLGLWAWFAFTALAESARVVQWRSTQPRRPLPATGRGPAGVVRQLVRLAMLSSVTGVAALGPLLPVRGPVAAGRVPQVPVLRPAAPIAADSTVDTPLGRAHEVVRGDSYWRIADHHLEDRFGREPSGREVYDYTEDLIGFNAPRLGHRDPTLIHPGELVVFTPLAGDPQSVVHERIVPDVVVSGPAATRPSSQVPAPTPPPVTTLPVPTPPPVTASPSTTPAVPTAAPTTTPSVRPSVPLDLAGRRDHGRLVSGLGAAVLVAIGATRVLDARRRRRLRAASVGARLAPPDPTNAHAEMTLRAHSDDERMARLDLALRAAAPDLAAQGARVVAAVLGDDGGVLLHLHGAATPSDVRWRVRIDDGAWVLPAAVPLEALGVEAGPTPQPSPALVCLGVLPEGRLFVDLESIGVLAIDAPEQLADDVVRHVTASLAVSPFADDVRLVTVGLDNEAGLGSDRAEVADSLVAARELAAAIIGSTSEASRGSSTFALRAGGQGETWEPVIVLAGSAAVTGDGAGSAAGLVDLAGRGGHGVGVVVAAPADGVEWVLRLSPAGTVLEPLGVDVTPIGLSLADVAAVQSLLAEADEPTAVHADVVTIGAARSEVDGTSAQPFDEPDWTLMVHVLGHVEVVSCDGEPAAFERGKSLELVVWLAQHRRHATRTGARTALWDLDVRDATFANVVSDARRAMARVAAPPEGEEWIGRTLTEQLPLHDGVVTDAELLERRVAHARGLSAADAIDVLRPGLALVTGMPFAGTSYLWPDAEGITSALTLLVTGAAIELARHYLTIGDAEGVFWATGQGLQVLAGHEELIALRMRAHAGAGDLAGVRHEWEAYERALAADPWSEGEPAPKLVALRRELLSPSLAS
jgi:hypothetical protein